jgi:predicted  nucleic acid-binding Zn-ribbon protein
MPIYDAGIRDLETDSLEIKKEILFQEKRVTEREIKIKLQTLSKRAQTLENEISDNQKKIDATRKLLNDTEYRAELLGEDFYKIISQTLELRRLFKSKSDLEWEMRLLASESLFVTERLIPAITLPAQTSTGS